MELWGLRGNKLKNQGIKGPLLEIVVGTYWGEQNLYLPSIRGLHEEVRLIVGKLKDNEGLTRGHSRGAEDKRTLSTFPVTLTG